MGDDFEPRDALAIAQAARERLADRAKVPAWYGIIYGLCCGAIVAAMGMDPPWSLLLLGIGLIALALLYRTWQQLTGLSVNGYRKGRTRTIALLLAVGLAGLGLAGLFLRKGYHIEWAPFAAGGAAVPVAILLSMAWDRAWRREILAGAAQ